MIARWWFGAAVLLLLVTTHAAADSIYGYVSQIEDNHFSIRTRYFPKVGFDISDQTEFRCHKERLPLRALRVGDLVDVDFRSSKHEWQAVRVKIRAKETDCSGRSQSRGSP
jgi:Domain of unknown function (DUF5666)